MYVLKTNAKYYITINNMNKWIEKVNMESNKIIKNEEVT